MMKTPDESKKGLEYCMSPACAGVKCPYFNAKTCNTEKTVDTLAYIQQLEAQNAELLKEIEELKAGKARAESSCAQMAGTIRNLRKQLAPEPPKEE